MSTDDFRRAYREQLAFLNGKLQATLRRIIAESTRPPVIILQADHGPQLGLHLSSLDKTDVPGRYSIFNAYLLPGGGVDRLYDSISPVNSFRVLFNHYLGTSYPLLEDKSYYTSAHFIYDFKQIPEERLRKPEPVKEPHENDRE